MEMFLRQHLTERTQSPSTWRPVAIDAVAVHVRSATEVNISLPVAAVILLPEWQWNPSWTQGRLYAGHKKDPTWLVRLISERACDYFKRSERGRALLESGYLITHGTKRHKKQVVDLGEDAVLLRTANSDRAAFCVLVAKDANDDDGDEPVQTEWSHSYIAMGLDLQHELQTALLFRTYNFEVAAAVLRAIGVTLDCGPRLSAMSFPQDEKEAVAKEGFLKAMEEAHVFLVSENPGQGLVHLSVDDPAVHAVANAVCVKDCLPFMKAVLGEERCQQLGRSFYS